MLENLRTKNVRKIDEQVLEKMTIFQFHILKIANKKTTKKSEIFIFNGKVLEI
jgi:hypothetical protein